MDVGRERRRELLVGAKHEEPTRSHTGDYLLKTPPDKGQSSKRKAERESSKRKEKREKRKEERVEIIKQAGDIY